MDQATLWMQLLLWVLFALATVGCAQSVREAVAAGLVRSAMIDVVVWVIALVVFFSLHHVIALSLAA